MEIQRSSAADYDEVMKMYDHAIAYQRKHGYNVWPTFSEQLIRGEIENGRHWKILVDGELACVFSVAYEDELLWGDRELGDAIYLHRIATHPEHKGKQFVRHIMDWSHVHAREHHRRYIRMDTWGDNQQLSDYYMRMGFKPAGRRYIEKNDKLPSHYWGIYLNLFEIDADTSRH